MDSLDLPIRLLIHASTKPQSVVTVVVESAGRAGFPQYIDLGPEQPFPPEASRCAVRRECSFLHWCGKAGQKPSYCPVWPFGGERKKKAKMTLSLFCSNVFWGKDEKERGMQQLTLAGIGLRNECF